MAYIGILGKDYKNCKTKSETITSEGTKVLITKLKHIVGIDFDKIIETDKAKENPEYNVIMKSFKAGKILDFSSTPNIISKLEIEGTEIEKMEEIIQSPEPEEEDVTPEEMETIVETEIEKLEDEDSSKMETTEPPKEEMIKLDEEDINKLIDSYAEEDIPENGVPEEEESEENEIKPVNAPRGWWNKKEFIDDDGNVFHKGKFVGNVNDAYSGE